jgi:hypothetical protein
MLVSCNSSKKLINSEYLVIRFNEKLPDRNKTIVQDYHLEVPVGGKLIKGKNDFTGDYHSEYRIIYADSSILYIGNDNWHGSRLNIVNRANKGIRGINKQYVTDSLYFEGVQFDGKYWKENILNDIVVGYVNVKPDEKSKYDKATHSVKPYK